MYNKIYSGPGQVSNKLCERDERIVEENGGGFEF